jgi:deoxycytidylate deaminase
MTEPQSLADVLGPPDSELVLGLVAPTGVDLDGFEHLATDVLKQFGYTTAVRRLSDMARDMASIAPTIAQGPEFKRVSSLQKAGSSLRKEAGRGDILALHAIARIHQERGDEAGKPQPLLKTAHLLRSLKHPDEVEALRRVYGVGFFLVGIHASHKTRVENLVSIKGMTEEEAENAIKRDESEDDPLGQQTRKTFHLADVFITDGDKKQLLRFLELVFGNPFHTPTPDEYAMFLAFGASLRSAQSGRQVGAVVVSETGELIATGTNDVPCFGGGLYWPATPGRKGRKDHRDHLFSDGRDSNKEEIQRIADDIRGSLAEHLKDGVSTDVIDRAVKKSRLADITEFGRAVHAEMEALLACARIGVSTHGATIYTTTFPCHNCAKHIVAAGVTRVLYVEPYPKSRAYDLHKDSIAVDDEGADKKVRFIPFVGVAARRYFDLFSMKLGVGVPLERKDSAGSSAKWKRTTAQVRPRMSPWSYIERERIAIELIDKAIQANAPTAGPAEEAQAPAAAPVDLAVPASLITSR